MKSFYLIGLLLVLALAYSKADKQMIRNAAQACKASEGASDEDVDVLAEGRMPETQTQKCLFSCVQVQFGLSDGKKFLKEGFLKHSEAIVGSGEENRRKAEEIAAECEKITNEDRCQLGADIAECIKQGMEKCESKDA
ncbi:hypothetical protein pipiens_005609 [Culex pipiens pipiens]|uniref:Odorant binding protein n=1 Tax=Culex pipiens pipiens TaxID=38569 RepID=A0ABD1DV89_CULPP